MQAKRFIAADMRRALDMVKTEFGEEAMILSTQRTVKGVELVATVEAPLAVSDPHNPMVQQQAIPGTQQKIANAAARFQSQAKTVPPHSDASTGLQTTLNTDNTRGSISGKTRQQLADEMELASQKMMAAKRAESMTLEQLSRDKNSRQKNGRERNGRENVSSTTPMNDGNHHAYFSSAYSQQMDLQEPSQAQGERQAIQQNEEILRLQNEIADMRQHLQVQLSQMVDIQERQYQASQSHIKQTSVQEVTPVAIEIRQHLDQLGLTKACNDQVMASLTVDKQGNNNKQLVWTEALAQLSRSIPYDTSDITASGGIYAFLGTTGVGKTTTIAKLAARYVMQHGGDEVILLTTDNYRIASHNQLKSLARILGIKVRIVEELEQLPSLLGQLDHYKLVLIDTPGMSHSDPLLKSHIKVLKQCPRVKNLLVLAASSQYQMMKASLHCYRMVGLSGCVLTKLDECASLGDAISMLSEHTVPLSYTTDGQSVPDDIAVTKASQLVAKAVSILKSHKQSQIKVRKSI